MRSELVDLSPEKIDEISESKEMKPYRTSFLRTVRMKPYMMSKEVEEVLALSSTTVMSFSEIYSSFSMAETKFENCSDSKGEQHELTLGTYLSLQKTSDRVLRENSFFQRHKVFQKYQGTLSDILNGVLQKDYFYAKTRGYSDCLEASLFPNAIDTEEYRTLINTIRSNGFPVLHRYTSLKKRILGVDDLHIYDLYAPLLPSSSSKNGDFKGKKYEYDESIDLVIDSTSVLGEEYQSKLREGLREQRWVDVFETERKRTGAYSMNHYDTSPFILLNFDGDLRDVFTLSHESGHSMHSLLSDESNPYHYARYSLLVAEVASTFNEILLFEYLRNRAEEEGDREMVLQLLNEELEMIRTTFFRQTLFAEFELLAHEFVENSVPITPEILNETFRKLKSDYYGENLVIDEGIEVEWSEVRHFFLYTYYCYQYATGLTAAIALSEMVNDQSGESEKYLEFLRGGSKKFPLELLEDAGVDMSTEKPFLVTIKKFERLLNKFEALYFEVFTEGKNENMDCSSEKS